MTTIFQKKEKEKKKLILIFIVLILIMAVIIWWKFFREVDTPQPQPQPYSYEELFIPIEINFEILRKPLKVILPYFLIELQPDPIIVIPNEKVDIVITLPGTIKDIPFTYKFDCKNDGKYEKTAENIYGKTFRALNVCQFEKPGEYTIRVSAEGEFRYFRNGKKIIKEKLVESFVKVIVKEINLPPVVLSCNVDLTKGSTLYNSKFKFSVEAYDPEGDKIVYFWDFGDRTTADISNPVHQYKKPGQFFPFVQVTDVVQGEVRDEKVFCYPDSLFLLREYVFFEVIKPFEQEIGRENPFIIFGEKIEEEEIIFENNN